MNLSQNVYTIMYMYVEEERLCVLKAGWTVVLFQLDSFLFQMGILLVKLSEDFQMLRQTFCCMKEFYLLLEAMTVLSAIRDYQRNLGLDVEENFVVGDSRVWKCIGKGNVKGIYACLVANGDTPKCLDRWSKTLDIVIDTK